MLNHVETIAIIEKFRVRIFGVQINGNKNPQYIDVIIYPDGTPDYAQCKKMHMIVIGCGIWDECFGKQQIASIKRICKKAMKQYYAS